MDIYHTTQKAVSGTPFHSKNKGVVISNMSSGNIRNVDIITYGNTGGTFSTRLIINPSETHLIPLRMWGLSFNSSEISAFGIS
jgi:hypothetical protein